MRRAATSPRTSVDPLSPALETSHSHHGHPAMSPTTRARPGSTSTSHPLMPGQFNGVLTGTSSLKGAVDLPREVRHPHVAATSSLNHIFIVLGLR